MRLKPIGLAALLAVTASPARADLLRARRASVMCASAGALARLGLPAGGSQDVGDHVPPAIAKIARDGNCTDFPEGSIVILQKARKHTSIVRSDSLSGDGVMIEALVANIDFAPYAPPHDVFYDAIRDRCADLLDGVAAEDAPVSDFIASLPTPLRTSIENAVGEDCGSVDSCWRDRVTEIDQRHLDDRWARFLCAHPKIAVEPNDRAAVPVRD